MDNAQVDSPSTPKGLALYNALGGRELNKTIPFLVHTSIVGDVLILELPLWTLHLRHGQAAQTVNIDVFRHRDKAPAQIANQLLGVPYRDLAVVIMRL
jgi:hypothetical protein